MSTNKWTDAQKEAIFTDKRANGDGCNLLVSAAAGSGKTAVLVRRIIEKLIPEDIEKGGSIDRLLVVTFTNAAAHEMETRINAALTEAYDDAAASGNIERKKAIKRQQQLLSSADITTIDAFCLKLVRANFSILGIDPDFSVTDSAQASILAEEAMEELFSELYDEGNEEFLNLLNMYGTSRSDEPLAELILTIHNYINSIPEPFKWLDTKTEETACPQGIENTAWYKRGLKDCKSNLSYAEKCVRDALEYMSGGETDINFYKNNPPEKGVPIFDEWKNYYKAFHTLYTALSAIDADGVRVGFTYPQFYALPSKTEEEKAPLRTLRENAKAPVLSAVRFLSIDIDEVQRQSREELYPAVHAVAELTKKFSRKFTEKKRAANLLEFSDIEQLAEELLRTNDAVASEMRARYDEILMDEYQDTSPLQEQIFSYITNGSNRFIVGDMKQSIYRFRSSDPSIFKHKSDTYVNEKDAENRKIVLSQNFRSRKEVLASVNDLFSAIMSEDAGELNYDSEQMLYYGNPDYTQLNDSYTSECCIIELPEASAEDDISATELEARFIAEEINRLKSSGFRVMEKKDKIRNLENRDIVILMSSYKSSADIYTSVFNEAGIECFAESQSYFERSEIRLITALLKIILNPQNDIPLIGIMRSPIGSFTDDELALIRPYSADSFYSAVCTLTEMYKNGEALDAEQTATAKKAEEFLVRLARWREYSRYMPSDRLIWALYEETDFYAFAGAMYDGEEAQANLRLLFERAREFENSGFQGLFSFIKYIERMKRSEQDLSSAKLVGEGHNVVRLMTIHKSKGLEFPVVFIAGGSKLFMRKAENPNILMHKELGIAVDRVDVEQSIKYETPEKAVFKSVIYAEQTSEEIRKLYVAATRAKEKLYFVASISGENKESAKPTGLKKYVPEKLSAVYDGAIAPQNVLSANRFADWVAPVALNSKNWIFRPIKADEINSSAKSENPAENTESREIDAVRLLDFKYNFAAVSDLPTKVSVSELKALHETALIPRPRFLESERTDGAHYGTALHTALQNIIPVPITDAEYVSAELARLEQCGILTAEETGLINPRKIVDFYASDIGKLILNAKAVHREQAFEVSAPANLLYPGLDIPDGEEIILQGIIDCMLEDDDGITIIDYKTDRFDDISEIREKYARQLELYAYAAQKITKKDVKSKIIYLFFDNSVLYL